MGVGGGASNSSPQKLNHHTKVTKDGRIILKWIFGQWEGGMDWIDLAEDRHRWRAFVNAVIDLQVP